MSTLLNLFSLPQFNHTHIVIWYQTPESWRLLRVGLDHAQKSCGFEVKLGETHKAVAEFFVNDTKAPDICDTAYHWMQGEIWSPNGEARDTIKAAGLSHTSMSVGDIIQVGERFFMCEIVGFKELDSTLFAPNVR